MKVFTKRNALLGALVTWIARKRIERRLDKVAGYTPGRRRLLLGAGVLSSVAFGVGALLVRRSSADDAKLA